MSLFREVAEDAVYRVEGSAPSPSVVVPEGFSMRLVPIDRLTGPDWSGITSLSGRFSARYLRWRYRGRRTEVLLVERSMRAVAVLWVVPSELIQRRYPFVDAGSSAIIACVTDPSCRGRGLYPAGVRAIAASGHSAAYFIWAHKTNEASLRGIVKAGGVPIGEFTRVRWFRGLISSTAFRPKPRMADRDG